MCLSGHFIIHIKHTFYFYGSVSAPCVRRQTTTPALQSEVLKPPSTVTEVRTWSPRGMTDKTNRSTTTVVIKQNDPLSYSLPSMIKKDLNPFLYTLSSDNEVST